MRGAYHACIIHDNEFRIRLILVFNLATIRNRCQLGNSNILQQKALSFNLFNTSSRCVYAVLHWAVMSNFSAYMVNMHMVNMQKQLVQRKHITCNPFVVFTHAHTSMAIRMHVFDIVFSLRMWYTSYSRPHAAYSVLHVHSL